MNKSKEYVGSESEKKPPTKSNGAYTAGTLPRIGGSKAEFLGTAVFDGGKMVEELNGDETRAMLMARNEFYRGAFVILDPQKSENIVTIDVRKQKKAKVTVNTKGKEPIVYLKVFLEGDILAIQSTVHYEGKKLKPILEEAFKEQIKKQLDKTIEKCKLLNCDVFKFGNVAAMNFWTIQEFEEYNWLKKFKDSEVKTEVDFNIRRTGTMLKSSEIKSSGENEGIAN